MSKIALTPNSSGTGTFTLAAPDSNTNRTLTLPDSAGELLTTTSDGSGLTGVVSFNPVAVSGTTPSLDVGTYNFFSQGAITANTTVSFASVPTNARWSYSFKPITSITDFWNVTTASYLQAFSVAAQETNPYGISFKPDGTKMYITGSSGGGVNEYNLSTAWDVSTASYLQAFSVASQDTTPIASFFKPDGLKMYIAGFVGQDINEYNLSTAWDVSTAVFLQLFSVASQETGNRNVVFSPDGLNMYICGTTGDDVNQYALSTAWDISTASYLRLFSVASQETYPQALFFKPDGLTMFVMGSTGDDVNEYTLSTAWNISTASYVRNKSVAAQDALPTAIFFKPDGKKMYMAGATGDNVYEYDLGAAGPVPTLTLPAAVENSPALALVANKQTTYDFYTLDGGTTVTLVGEVAI